MGFNRPLFLLCEGTKCFRSSTTIFFKYFSFECQWSRRKRKYTPWMNADTVVWWLQPTTEMNLEPLGFETFFFYYYCFKVEHLMVKYNRVRFESSRGKTLYLFLLPFISFSLNPWLPLVLLLLLVFNLAFVTLVYITYGTFCLLSPHMSTHSRM